MKSTFILSLHFYNDNETNKIHSEVSMAPYFPVFAVIVVGLDYR